MSANEQSDGEGIRIEESFPIFPFKKLFDMIPVVISQVAWVCFIHRLTLSKKLR